MARPRYADTAEGRRQQEEKYGRILDAALEIFARKGYSEARISEIARCAGVADGTIYLYFKNKDDLLISLFESHLEAINAGLRTKLQGLHDPRKRLRRIIRYHFQVAIESPDLAAFITVELRRSAKFMKDYAKEQFAEYIDQIGRVVEDGKATGVFDSDMSAGTFKHLVFGCLDQAVVTWLYNPNRKPEALLEVSERLTEFLLRGLNARSEHPSSANARS